MEQGCVLGAYVVDRELGSGAMGTVYRATVGAREQAVALKVVHPHLLSSPAAVARFRREVAIGRTIRHPNVVRTIDGGETDGRHWLAMELVEGQTVHALRAELERVPEALCLHIAREVARGLAAIHGAGVLHRDIKPENVLITPEHDVKIMDLGIARVVDDAIRVSATGAFVGSLQYAAPECFRADFGAPDQRADLHALGLVLYELATGVAPYSAPDLASAIGRVLDEVPRRVGELNPQLSPFFEEVVHTLLVKDPRGRFASADELVSVLDDGESGAWWQARTRSLRVATRRPLRRVRVPRETAVYGRDEELARLRGLWERVRDGEGQAVLVAGEAGIGKSRLVDELVFRLQQEGEDLRFLFGGYPPSGAATVSGAWCTAFREELGPDGSARHLQDNPLLVPAFDALLRGESASPGIDPLTKDALQTCFVRVAQSLAADRPVVLLVDDLHFAPPEGRALFTALAHAISGHRVLLVGTHRRKVDDAWRAGIGRLAHASEITLGRLGARDLVRLLEDTLHSEHMAAELAGRIALKSDGNPFFVFEIVKSLRDHRYLRRTADGTWVSTQSIDQIDIPASVLDLVNARVAALGAEERDLLDIAACCGFRFDAALVGEVAGLDRIDALKSFGRIERRHHVVRSAGRELVFDHHQVQEALYGGLHEPLREEYHALIGEALERRENAGDRSPDELPGDTCIRLAEHFLRSARPERARRYVTRALEETQRGGLLTDALDLARRALAVPGLLAGEQRFNVLSRQASGLRAAGRVAEERAAAEESLALAEELSDTRLQAWAHTTLATTCNGTGAVDDSLRHAKEALRLAQEAGNRAMVGHAHRALGISQRNAGDLAQALEHERAALAIAQELGDRDAEAAVSSNLGGTLFDLGRTDEARASYERAIRLAQEVGNRSWEGAATLNLGGVFHVRSDFARALEQARRAYEIWSAMGDRRAAVNAIAGTGMTLARLGVLDQARSAFERCRALALELAVPRVASHALLGLASIAYERDELDETARNATAAAESARTARDAVLEGEAQLWLVRVARERGDLETLRAEIAATGVMESSTPAALLRACHLALVDREAIPAALAALDRFEGGTESRMEAHLLVWQATGDGAHLRAARLLHDELLSGTPAEYRDSQAARRLYRTVAAAAAQLD